jgi:hypothetical protein
MIVLDLSILNQKGTPMFNSDTLANRPAAGIVGRIFIAIDSPFGIYRDTGTAWDQISSVGVAATTIYNGDGTLTGNRTISSGGFQLVFNPQTTFFSSLTASTSASSFSVLGSNALTFAVGFSSSNIGNVYGANGAINAQIFSGNATFAQANLASAMVNVNKIDFSSGGHTITMTQSTAPGIRAMTGTQNQIQFTGSHNGTISHAAISQNLGFFRESGSTRTLTITNAYSHLINPLDDYGAGFTFTNRWGIYQAGSSDKNYFAGNVLLGTTTDGGQRLQVIGDIFAQGTSQFRNSTNYQIRLSDGTFKWDLRSQATQSNCDLRFIDDGGVARVTMFNNYGMSIGNPIDNSASLAITGIGATSATSSLIIKDSGGSLIFRVRNDGVVSLLKNYIDFFGTIAIGASNDGINYATNALGILYAVGNRTSAGVNHAFFGGNVTNTSGSFFHMQTTGRPAFVPTSGTGVYNILSLEATINQTGGANGISRGLYILPSLVSAADWRAIEVNAGISIFAPSTTASATLRVPSGTTPTTPTNGDIWFDGTNLFMRIGGITKTFTII